MNFFASQARAAASSSTSTFTPRTPPQQHQHCHGGISMTGFRYAQQQQQQQYLTQNSPADNSSLSSRGSNGHHTSLSSSQTSLGSSNADFHNSGTGSLSHGIHGEENPNNKVYGYYLDRGDGQFTRLIPADLLPPLSGVAPREEEHDGMVILPPLQKLQLHGNNKDSGGKFPTPKQLPLPDNLQNQIDCIVATSPKSTRRVKIYCDKWIHEGVCAFTQQGCKFKHEMPQDEATQKSLGLFHGYPAWWRKRAEEQQQQQNSLRRVDTTTTTISPSASPNFLGRPVSVSSYVSGPENKSGFNIRVQEVQQPVAEERGWPQRDEPTAVAAAAASSMYGQAGGFARISGSQWMQNGIVPVVRGPRRAY